MLPDYDHHSSGHSHSSSTNYPLPNDNSLPYNHTLPHNSTTHVRKHCVPKANGDEAKSSEDCLQRIRRQSLQLCRMLLDANDNSCSNHYASTNNHALPNNHTCPDNHALPNNRPIHLQDLLLPSSIHHDFQA